MPNRLPNTLIIEGHGETYDPKSAVKANYFDFKRAPAVKCAMYSYVFEGKLMPADASNEKIKYSVRKNGDIPAGWVEVIESRTGGRRVRDRIIYAIDYKIVHGNVKYDWNYELPSSWGATTVEFDAREGGSVDVIFWYDGANPKSSTCVWLTLRGEGPDDPTRSILLSQVIDYFNTQSYNILWMVCRE